MINQKKKAPVVPSFISLVMVLALGCAPRTQDTQSVFMADGIKVGEATHSTAIVWMRLTENAERNLDGIPWGQEESKVPEGATLDEMVEAVPGAPGEVRVEWSLPGGPKEASDWLRVNPEKDYTRQLTLTGLEPGKAYDVTVSSRSPEGDLGQVISGGFRTVPLASEEASARFMVVTGQEFRRRDDPLNGHKIYRAMLGLDPDFFVHTGDIVYYDHKFTIPKANTVPLCRYKWNRMSALPFQRAFHNAVTSYFIKDDHDLLKNDCWPGQTYGEMTWADGLRLFSEQLPVGASPYRTVRWGKDVQIWFVEGREFRSANDSPDGPDKTIWGEEQKAWFFKTVSESDATFRLLISATPVVGPDRAAKNDNHANAGFTFEGDQIRAFIGQQKNMYVICGDRHWQYVSVDDETGVKEFCSGPTSMEHAGGFTEKERSDMHQYLNVVGGFLEVEVARVGGQAVATFRHRGVDGAVLNEDIVRAD